MATGLTRHELERRLIEEMTKDRDKAKRKAGIQIGGSPRTIQVPTSNAALGLAIAIGEMSGEDAMDVIRRLEGDVQ